MDTWSSSRFIFKRFHNDKHSVYPVEGFMLNFGKWKSAKGPK
jgi:hypothetical protein